MDLSGIFAPVPTPFTSDGSLDTARLAAALGRWLRTPLTGVVVLGSNGEAVFLTEDESDRVIATAREAVPRTRPLIIGTGRESTTAAVRATKRAAELGADVVLVRTPGFFRSQMTADVLVRHYTTIADASPVPVLLYNFTNVTGVDLPVAAAHRLAAHPNVIGMKESNGDIAKVAELVAGAPGGFQVLSGSATVFLAALAVGAAGGILALSALVPDACARLFAAARAGRYDEALAIQRQIAPLGRLVGPTYGVAGLKAALKLAGYDVGVPRPPLLPAPDAAVAALGDALAALHHLAV